MRRKLRTFAAATGALLLLAAAADAGEAWKVTEGKSPVDDTKTLAMELTSNDSFIDLVGNKMWGALVISCADSRSMVGIWAGGLVAGNDVTNAGRAKIIYRIDSSPAKSASLLLTTDFRIAGFFDGETYPFVKKLANAKSLFVRLTPGFANTVDLTFDLTGLPAHLPKLREVCRW